ncbi:MAG: mechanosensitive ion channel family protein [Ignavibacteriae bacterium]|nr:mechanosensitive ion channel family protein [Ignavibacteriota bacterium]
MLKFLEHVYWGNSVQTWLIAIGIAALSMFVLEILKRVAARRLKAFAETTATDVDDLAADLLERIRFLSFFVVSIYIASFSLKLRESVTDVLGIALVVALLLQGGIWGNSIINYWVARTVKQRMQRDAANATTLTALGYLGKIVLWTVVLLVGLDNMGVDITALVAGLGVGGIAVALALQNILGDLFASLSIVLDKPFVIGDFIIVDTYMGTVEHIGLKTTRIRSLSGEQVIFSNGDLLKSRVRNFKRMYERRIVFTVGVTYQTPHDKLAEIPKMIRAIIESQRKTRFDRSHFMSYGDSSLVFETVYFVLDADYNIYMDIQQAINLAIFKRFEEENIQFAYPTRTVVIQQDSSVEVPVSSAKR